jgi:TolA-binding protein
MKPARCAMVPLLEARRDGRLGDRESASLDRHLAGCASCRTYEQDLDRLRALLQQSDDARPTPLEHQRGRLRLLRAAATPPAPTRRLLARRALPSLALACTVLISVAGFAVVRHLPGRHAETTAAASPPASAAIPSPGPPPARPAPADAPEETAAAVEEPAPPLPSPEKAPPPVRAEPKQEAPVRAAVRMPAPAAPRVARRPEVDTSKAFGEAMDLLGRGDYAAANARLDAFRRAHPGDARADLAAFLAIVSLQHAGRNDEAREAARRYLTLYPEGDRRADAARVAYERTP